MRSESRGRWCRTGHLSHELSEFYVLKTCYPNLEFGRPESIDGLVAQAVDVHPLG